MQHNPLFRNQDYARRLFASAEAFVRFVYQERTVQGVPETDLQRIIEEFSRLGVAEAVPRYFRDMNEEIMHKRDALYAQTHFPVFLLQGARDPAQPKWYFNGTVSLFPRAELHFVPDAGQPALFLLGAVQSYGIDLAVLCSHGRTGFSRWALGSVAHALVHQAPYRSSCCARMKHLLTWSARAHSTHLSR